MSLSLSLSLLCFAVEGEKEECSFHHNVWPHHKVLFVFSDASVLSKRKAEIGFFDNNLALNCCLRGLRASAKAKARP